MAPFPYSPAHSKIAYLQLGGNGGDWRPGFVPRRYYGEKSEVWNMSKDTTPKISRETVPQYFSRGWICVSRGWDSIAIEKFLPIPDRVMPHSGGAADVLYRRDRVKEIEDSFEFKVDTWRRRGLHRDGETLTHILQQFYVDPNFIGLSKVGLLRAALWHYVEREYPDESPEIQKYQVGLLGDCPADTKERLMVNYLRHMGTNYEQLVSATEGRRDFYVFILWQALNRIAEEYPYLQKECRRQLALKRNETGDFNPPRGHAPYVTRAHKHRLARRADRKWRRKYQHL